jgi:hypothetical protein
MNICHLVLPFVGYSQVTILREEVSHPGVSLVDLELVPLDVGA